MRVVMISGGDIDPDFALAFLRKYPADRVIAVDRGLKFCAEYGVAPDYIVGDFDSLPAGILEQYEKRPDITVRRLVPEKDDSDTECAMNMAMELCPDRLVLLGGTGTRFDHMLANLQLLAYAGRRGVPMCLADAHNLVTVLFGRTVLRREEQFGRYVSFFALGDEVSGLTLRGFKYPLTDHRLTNLSCGLTLSNEITAEEATVAFSSGMLVMVQSRD